VVSDLQKIYSLNKRSELEISISLDTSKREYADYVARNGINWLAFADFKAWDGPIAKLYNVIGTPSMFLLDANKRIIAKPRTVEEILRSIKED
jgi:hypothetical protein